MGRDASACHTKLLLETKHERLDTVLKTNFDLSAQVNGESQQVKKSHQVNRCSRVLEKPKVSHYPINK
jgi:hypothetical protein